MEKLSAYRILCGIAGALFAAAGLACFAGFFRAQAPGGEAGGPIPLGIGGVYFLAFTGCALVGWGGALIAGARDVVTGRLLAPVTALALTGLALYRMVGWFMGDYHALAGDLLRYEAALFLALALAFVWLRPAPERRIS